METINQKLFTVVSDYEGGTLIEQFKAKDLRDLFDKWISGSSLGVKGENISEDDYNFVLIKNTKNVWCTSATDKNGNTVFVNAILTIDD